MMHRNKSVDVHNFAMVPRPDIPRSSFKMERTYKTTFDSGLLVPIFCEEMLPGDTFNTRMTAFARMVTPVVPVMDNLYLDCFFFFVPNRLVWSNWVRFMGEQPFSPSDTISFAVPTLSIPSGGYGIGTVFDYFGLPTAGQYSAGTATSHSVLPLRAYNLIWNQWFRDENLQSIATVTLGDSGDAVGDFNILRRGKRHDYFTSALPWVQKGGTSVSLPLGTSAPVKTNATDVVTGAQAAMRTLTTAGAAPPVVLGTVLGSGTSGVNAGSYQTVSATGGTTSFYPSNLYADLSTATAATINQIRQAFQIQKLLERDARGGTRYTELVQAHFGVRSPDARLQRPEYLGGGSYPITVAPIAQTSATGLTGGSTPGGNLNAVATGLAQSGFTYASTEHGYVIGLCSVRADLTYQQGLRKHWSRSTRYDFYFPAFAMLGEQAIYNREIYCDGSANDAGVFGYQERWAEYRYLPSEITGKLRSTASGTLDVWHLAQKFTSLPSMGTTFIQDSPPISRISAVPSEPQFKLDAFFSIKAARPLPMYSVPGLMDHF